MLIFVLLPLALFANDKIQPREITVDINIGETATTHLFVEVSEHKNYLKHTIGEFELISVQDGKGEIANSMFSGASAEEIAKLAPKELDINTFVLRKGKTTILIDTGKGGDLIANLKSAGIEPSDVNAVFLTHSHFDHVSGLLKDDKAVFSNAKIWIAEKEIEFWQESSKEHLEKCKRAYGEFSIVIPDEKTAILLPEIVALDISGHTPGHTAFLVRSNGNAALIVGDLLHSGELQIKNPDICAIFDKDKEKSAKIRKDIMKRAAAEAWLFSAAHLPNFGMGYLNEKNEFVQLK